MNRRHLIAAAAVLFVAAIVLLTGTGEAPAGASSLSRAPNGWLAARTYLELSGLEVALLDVPWDRAEAAERLAAADTFVIAFPWFATRLPSPEVLDSMVERGGTLIVAYSGSDSRLERELFGALGLPLERIRPDSPLSPWRWRRFRRATVELHPTGRSDLIAHLRFPDVAPRMPSSAKTLWRSEEAPVAVFRTRRGRGAIVVLPSGLLVNGRLERASNVEVLETLRSAAGSQWLIDEFHHGLRTTSAGADPALSNIVWWMLLQLALLYGLAVWSLGRALGPRSPRLAERSGSPAGFLLGLGHLHAHLGHHREAARQLVDILQRYHPEAMSDQRSEVDARLAGRLDGQRFVALINRLMEHRPTVITDRGGDLDP